MKNNNKLMLETNKKGKKWGVRAAVKNYRVNSSLLYLRCSTLVSHKSRKHCNFFIRSARDKFVLLEG